MTTGPTEASEAPEAPTTTEPGVVVETEGARGFVDYSGFEEEYQVTADELTASLPPGFEFPAEITGSWDPAGSFEVGVGEMQAGFYWQCAWSYTYTQSLAAGDTAAANHALDELEAWVDLPEVKPNIDELTRQIWLDSAIAPARAGDDTQLLAMSVGGCSPASADSQP